MNRPDKPTHDLSLQAAKKNAARLSHMIRQHAPVIAQLRAMSRAAAARARLDEAMAAFLAADPDVAALTAAARAIKALTEEGKA